MCYSIYAVVLAMTTISIYSLCGRFDSGYYSLLMMKGGNRYSYALSMYFSDVLTHLIVMGIMYTMVVVGGIPMYGFWLPLLIFCLANPLFNLMCSYFFCYGRKTTKVTPLLVITILNALAYI